MAKDLLRNLYMTALGRMQRFPTVLTDREKLLQLIKSLHPVDPGIELIRLGPDDDGGYLIPNDLVGIDACFSPGVSDVSGFESACAERGIKIYLADKSVAKPPTEHELFRFIPKFIGAINSDSFITVDTWVNANEKDSGDLILQMDIEGYEYESLLNISDSLMDRFRIIVVEFHGLANLWSEPFFNLSSAVFNKLLKSHACVHIHPNNCSRVLDFNGVSIVDGMEFTFLRRDRLSGNKHFTAFPHPLDRDNLKHLKPIPLPRDWYEH